jgi:hypothetical protein
MIVGDQNRDHEATNGSDTRTSPPLSDGPALIRPPRAATRCRIDDNPTPAVHGARILPLSVISSCN